MRGLLTPSTSPPPTHTRHTHPLTYSFIGHTAFCEDLASPKISRVLSSCRTLSMTCSLPADCCDYIRICWRSSLYFFLPLLLLYILLLLYPPAATHGYHCLVSFACFSLLLQPQHECDQTQMLQQQKHSFDSAISAPVLGETIV